MIKEVVTIAAYKENVSEKDREFLGKSVVVTGAGAGMGKSITEEFLKQGATVIAVDINKNVLDNFKAELEDKYNRDVAEHFIPVVGDISRKETNGNIVTIASVAEIKGCRSSVAYSISKHGLVGLCEHTAYSYMHKGIRCNIVCTGAIRTGMTSNPELESEFGRSRILSGMDSQVIFGETNDIANAVLTQEELLQQLRNLLMIMDITIQASLLTKQTGRHILSRQVLKSLRIQMVTWIMQ